MNKASYTGSLQQVRDFLVEAEALLADIANDNAFGKREFLETTSNVDDVALHLHRATTCLRKAYKDHVDVLS